MDNGVGTHDLNTRRDVYVLTTSPSGRARPLGPVVKTYTSLKTGRSGSIDREAFPYADQCVATVLLSEANRERSVLLSSLTKQSLSGASARLYAFQAPAFQAPDGLRTLTQG